MALTATRTTDGFEPFYHFLGRPIIARKYLLTPNTAFSKGDMVVLTANKVAKAAAGATKVLGVMAAAYTTTTNPTADEVYGLVWDDPWIVYKCTFADHRDAAATGGSTTTIVDTALSTSADDVWNGALAYIYSGTNSGDLRTITDYTGSTDTLTVSEVYPAAVDTTSNYILLGAGLASGENLNVGTIGVDLKDENTVDANATTASDAGPLVIPSIDREALRDMVKDLILPVMIRKHLYNSP